MLQFPRSSVQTVCYSDELDEDPDRLPPSEDTAQGPACVLTLCALCFKSVDTLETWSFSSWFVLFSRGEKSE